MTETLKNIIPLKLPSVFHQYAYRLFNWVALAMNFYRNSKDSLIKMLRWNIYFCSPFLLFVCLGDDLIQFRDIIHLNGCKMHEVNSYPKYALVWLRAYVSIIFWKARVNMRVFLVTRMVQNKLTSYWQNEWSGIP